MANSYDSGLVQEILSDSAITTLGPLLAPVDSFTLDVGVDPLRPKSVVNVPVVTAGSAVLTNPANFENGDSTVDIAEVTVDLKSVPFHATAAEMNIGHRLKNLLDKNLQVLGNAIQDVIYSPITVANFGAAVIDKDAASFTAADLPTIWAAAKDFPQRNLFLAGEHYAKLLPTNMESFNPSRDGAFGFDRIFANNRFAGAEADTVGFVAAPNAIAIATGEAYMPENVKDDLSGMETVVLPNGITVALCTWVSRATRAEWASVDIMIGAAAGDKTALKIVQGGGA